jgi:hypothetical protein
VCALNGRYNKKFFTTVKNNPKCESPILSPAITIKRLEMRGYISLMENYKRETYPSADKWCEKLKR